MFSFDSYFTVISWKSAHEQSTLQINMLTVTHCPWIHLTELPALEAQALMARNTLKHGVATK